MRLQNLFEKWNLTNLKVNPSIADVEDLTELNEHME